MNNKWFTVRRKLLNNIVWILLLFAIILIGGMEPSFFTPRILGNVLSQATVLGILSFAQAFAIMLGLIDLSLLGVMSFSATMGLLLIGRGAPVLIAIPVILAVGNAPTALVRACQLMDEGKFSPALVIGVPVGFVNVVESKELLCSMPGEHIAAMGRKGGSNIAAAICNAMLYLASGNERE